MTRLSPPRRPVAEWTRPIEASRLIASSDTPSTAVPVAVGGTILTAADQGSAGLDVPMVSAALHSLLRRLDANNESTQNVAGHRPDGK